MAQIVAAEADSTIIMDRYFDNRQVVPTIPDTVFGDFKVLSLLGKGAFNEAYLGVHMFSGQEVAIKLELSNASHKQLLHELKVYSKIGPFEIGFPIVYLYEENFYEPVSSKVFNYICMERLGSSLSSLFHRQQMQFSIKTTLMIGMQVISRLQKLHSLGVVHRDVKPDNLLIGVGSGESTIHLIDFGMASEFWDMKTNSHKPMQIKQKSVGTMRYSSVNTHLGFLQSRRDDLETLGHVLIYFLRGRLPWSGPFEENLSPTEKHSLVYQTKAYTSPELLCSGFPLELAMYLRYCRMLQYDEVPNYSYLKGLFKKAAGNLDLNLEDGIFDWTQPEYGINRSPWNH